LPWGMANSEKGGGGENSCPTVKRVKREIKPNSETGDKRRINPLQKAPLYKDGITHQQ